MHGAGLPGIDKVFPLASESGEMGREENVCVCSRGFCIPEMQSRLHAGSRAGMFLAVLYAQHQRSQNVWLVGWLALQQFDVIPPEQTLIVLGVPPEQAGAVRR